MSELEEILKKGRDAEQLLNDPTLNQALEELLSEASLGWLATNYGDFEARDDLYRRAHVHQFISGIPARHGRDFQKMATQICRRHGFDPLGF